MIRVNHAGEYGAKRIYEGQLSVLGKSDCADMIQHMADQEREHLQAFEKYIVERHVRPTVLTPIWHVLGFTLGAGTALMGKEAAMACTVAVEEVIDEHYQKQLHTLGSREPKLTKDIARFREEELEHRDIGLEHDAEKAPGYPLLSAFIKTASRTAIWLSERV
ncbi:MAG: demethoxyubiquinone hydroxylase family protein [Rickettsiales bacterium]|nr:demethoxyubiquinone hydroxylase family protein [Rickettsiales bacterium]